MLALLIVLVLTAPFTLWLFVIRRYCVRNGMGYTPGANWDVTMWIDWQQAREMAAARSEGGMVFWCRLFLTIKLLYAVFGFIAIAAFIIGN